MTRNILKCFVGLLISLLASLSMGCNPGEVEIVVGHRAPDFTLASIDGETMKSRSDAGQVIVLNFWATRCQNCKE